MALFELLVWPHEVEPWFHSWYSLRGRVETLDTALFSINTYTNIEKAVNVNSFLPVALPPVIINPPLSTAAEFGLPTVLTCNATAQPPPSYSWFRREGNNSVLIEREETEVLIFNNLNPSNRGVYLCEAKNEVGVATSNDAILSIDGEFNVMRNTISFQ